METHIYISFIYFTLVNYDLGPLSFGILSICFSPKGDVANLALWKVFILSYGLVSNGLCSD